MTEKTPYSFTVLRYVHDVVTSEFVNVGLVLQDTRSGEIHSKFRRSMGRVRAAFPGLDRMAFLSAMKSVRKGLRALSGGGLSGSDLKKTGLESGISDAGGWARLVLPADDSVLQWSPVGSGLTDDIEGAVERLYERFVTRNDLAVAYRTRTDDDIWRPVRRKLAERRISLTLQRKTVIGTTDRIVFERACKNSVWHAYEPISFDLADADGIKDKARRWRGHLDAAAEGATDDVELRLILGAPGNPELLGAYESACAILQHAPFKPKIYPEDRISELVDEIEDEVRAHQATLRGQLI